MVNSSNVNCEIDDNKLIYQEDNIISNIIDFSEQSYERDTLESNIKVDFKNNVLTIYVKDLNQTFTSIITSKFQKNKKEIILEYILEEKIKILIQLL